MGSEPAGTNKRAASSIKKHKRRVQKKKPCARAIAMTAPHFPPTALSPDEHATQLRRAVIAATIGTSIEWYDFFLYSTVTGLVFAKLFFPKSDPLVGTLEAFAIYAVGVVAGPWWS